MIDAMKKVKVSDHIFASLFSSVDMAINDGGGLLVLVLFLRVQTFSIVSNTQLTSVSSYYYKILKRKLFQAVI